MDKKFHLSSFWVLLALVITLVGYLKVKSYLDASVAYQQEECGHKSYMIYKGYDDLPEEVRRRDWLQRIDECAKIQAEYQKLGL